jgi:hypothetical protein
VQPQFHGAFPALSVAVAPHDPVALRVQRADAHSVAPPLRVAVVLDGDVQAAWVRRILETLRRSSYATLAAVIFGRRAPRTPWPRIASLYARFDRTFFSRSGNALERASVHPLLDRVEIIVDHPRRVAELEVDVLLLIGATVETTRPKARFGVWKIEVGSKDDTFPGLREFVTGIDTTTAVLRRVEDGAVLGWTRGGTDPISLFRGMNRLYWKLAGLIERRLARLHRERTIAPQTVCELPPTALRLNNRRLFAALVATAARFLRDKIRESWMREQWIIAFRFRHDPNDTNTLFRSFHRIVPPDDRFWADPFVISEGGRTWIFVEELVYSEAKGVIAVIEVQRDGSWSTPRRVLERPYHLSYPCVFRWNGDIYMLPETQENKTIELYRAVEFPDRWELSDVLMRDVEAVDATMFEANGRWWMYLSTAASPVAGFDELSLYYADTPRGPWLPHARNPLLCDVVGGRCGGRPFLRGGVLLRATQDCARRYGHSIRMREIVKLTPEEWEEREVDTVTADWTRDIVGTHTLNVDGEVTVIDGLRHRRARAEKSGLAGLKLLLFAIAPTCGVWLSSAAGSTI